MRKKPKKIILIIILAVVAIAALFYFFGKQVANAPEASSREATSKQEEVSATENSETVSTALSWSQDQMVNAKVLMYHHIGPLPENPDSVRVGLTVSAEKFESQMKYLSDNGYNVITLTEMYDFVAKGTLPEKSVVLTFDDGYSDNYVYAYPILKKYNMHGTFFIISDFLGRSDTMTQANIVDLYTNGNEIGSHTKTHPSLEQQNETKATAELVSSKEYLEKLTGRPVVSLCYPAGKYNDATMQFAKTAGYKMAVTTKAGKPFSTNSPFEIPRYRMNPDTNISTILK